MQADFVDHVEQIQLVDHHVHSIYREDGAEARFQNLLNEGSRYDLHRPEAAYDSQIGYAIRRWCSELIELEPHVPVNEYWKRRAELGEAEIGRRMMAAAGVSHWLIDTGNSASMALMPLSTFDPLATGALHEIIRLEELARDVMATLGDPADYAESFRAALAGRRAEIVGAKSIMAYLVGFNHDFSRPADHAVADAARRWRDEIEANSATKYMSEPTLIIFGIHAALDQGLPLQLHTGYGDYDVRLLEANPLYLMDFLRNHDASGVPIILIHCYPYEREAGYLAQAFETVYFDVGLSTNYVGARSTSLIARSLELAPFGKVLYSSDAVGSAELHYLGARLWRNAMSSVIGKWAEDGDWSMNDAKRVATMIGRDNALRVYKLD